MRTLAAALRTCYVVGQVQKPEVAGAGHVPRMSPEPGYLTVLERLWVHRCINASESACAP